MGERLDGAIPGPTAALVTNHFNRGRKVPRCECWPNGRRRLCQQSTFENTMAGCEVTPLIILRFSPDAQISEYRSSTICAVVERPDHHFDDNLAQDWRANFRVAMHNCRGRGFLQLARQSGRVCSTADSTVRKSTGAFERELKLSKQEKGMGNNF